MNTIVRNWGDIESLFPCEGDKITIVTKDGKTGKMLVLQAGISSVSELICVWCNKEIKENEPAIGGDVAGDFLHQHCSIEKKASNVLTTQ